jgi:hypothetical protein
MNYKGWTIERIDALLSEYEALPADAHRGKALVNRHGGNLHFIYGLLDQARKHRQLTEKVYNEDGIKVTRYKTVSAAYVPFRNTAG